MITIKELVIKQDHRYLWLKHVADVDLSQHCAKCLIGEYLEFIDVLEDRYENIILPADTFYLCGVAIPFIWENNIHLAFRYSEGDRVSIDNDSYKIELENAKVIEISKDHIDYNLPKAKYKKYNTCRNWWFANWFEKNNKS